MRITESQLRNTIRKIIKEVGPKKYTDEWWNQPIERVKDFPPAKDAGNWRSAAGADPEGIYSCTQCGCEVAEEDITPDGRCPMCASSSGM